MKILLSIKPEFVEEIFRGKKRFEYRRTIFKRTNINKVVVYATKPIGLIVGEFSIEQIIKETPQLLWEKTYEQSGISKTFFDEYFEGKEVGFALKIKSPQLYKNPIDPTLKYKSFVAPQSFKYIDDEINTELEFSF
jgi:predicted transcriptional regulator